MADVIWHLEAYNNCCRLALIQLFELVTFAELWTDHWFIPILKSFNPNFNFLCKFSILYKFYLDFNCSNVLCSADNLIIMVALCNFLLNMIGSPDQSYIFIILGLSSANCMPRWAVLGNPRSRCQTKVKRWMWSFSTALSHVGLYRPGLRNWRGELDDYVEPSLNARCGRRYGVFWPEPFRTRSAAVFWDGPPPN